MPDATPSPAAPTAAPQAPAAPTHHSHLQPRDTGRFAGPPQAAPATPPAPAGETPAERLERIRLSFKEDGRVVEEELSLQELAELRRKHRSGELHSREAAQRLERANQLAEQVRIEREAMEAQRRRLLGDPNALLEFARKNGGQGFDPLSYLTKALESVLAEREMTPEQRELAKLKAEKAENERRQKEEQDKYEQQERVRVFNEEVAKRREAWLSTLEQAITQHGLPVTEESVDSASRHILSAMRQGIQVSPEQAAEYAKAQTFHHFNGLVGKMDGAAIRQHFPEVFRAVHRYLAAQAKGMQQGQQPAGRPMQQQPKQGQQPERPQVYSTWG